MEERGELARIVGKAVLVEGFLRSLPVAFSDPGNEVARATRNCTAARRAAATTEEGNRIRLGSGRSLTLHGKAIGFG